MEISFNDASLDGLFTEKMTTIQGRDVLEKFLEILKLLKQANLFENLFVTEKFFSIFIAKNYTVNDWLHDSNVNMNYKQFFRACLGKAIYIESEQLNGEAIFQISQNRISSIGAAFSVEHFDKPIIISLQTSDFWENESIECLYSFLDNDAKIIDEECFVFNITKGCNIDKLKMQQRRELYSYISSGQDLWEKRVELFPNLTFCDAIKKQLYEDSEKYHIIKVMERLEKMQEYFSRKHERYLPQDMGMNARTESESVKINPELKKLRMFKLPSGKEEYFYDHISFSSGKYSSGRIHFFPDVENNNCYIGYIGNHLPTKQF